VLVSIVVVLGEGTQSFAGLDLYPDDLVIESAGGLGLAEPLLRPQGSLVPILSGDLKLLGQILGTPSGVFVRKGIV